MGGHSEKAETVKRSMNASLAVVKFLLGNLLSISNFRYLNLLYSRCYPVPSCVLSLSGTQLQTCALSLTNIVYVSFNCHLLPQLFWNCQRC